MIIKVVRGRKSRNIEATKMGGKVGKCKRKIKDKNEGRKKRG